MPADTAEHQRQRVAVKGQMLKITRQKPSPSPEHRPPALKNASTRYRTAPKASLDHTTTPTSRHTPNVPSYRPPRTRASGT
jgi:hypothetical protein